MELTDSGMFAQAKNEYSHNLQSASRNDRLTGKYPVCKYQ